LALLYLGVVGPALAALTWNAITMDGGEVVVVETATWPDGDAPLLPSAPGLEGRAPRPPAPLATMTAVAESATAVATAGQPIAPGYRASPSPPGCPAVIHEVFGAAAPEACAIAYCETGGTYDPAIRGDAGASWGLFQINTGWHGPRGPHGWASWYGVAPEDLLDPLTNTLVARAIYDYLGGRFGGPGGWTCAAIIGVN
jgi:hypothetical protein